MVQAQYKIKLSIKILMLLLLNSSNYWPALDLFLYNSMEWSDPKCYCYCFDFRVLISYQCVCSHNESTDLCGTRSQRSKTRSCTCEPQKCLLGGNLDTHRFKTFCMKIIYLFCTFDKTKVINKFKNYQV